MNTDSSDLTAALILISFYAISCGRVSLFKDEQAIVAEVSEMEAECLEKFIFFIPEEVFFLLNKLSDDVSEQAKSVREILHVIVSLTAYADNLAENRFLGEELEAVLVLAKLLEDCVGIKCHLVVFLIFGRELIDQEVNNESALLLENGLHVLLLCSKFALIIIVVVDIAALTGFPCHTSLVFLVLVWLDLNLEERDQKKRQRVMLQVLKKSIEYLTVLLNEKILENVVLLLDQ